MVIRTILFGIGTCLLLSVSVNAQVTLDDYTQPAATGQYDYERQAVIRQEQFNGYTNYWHNSYRNWVRYASLFKMGAPNVAYTLAQHKADVAEDLGIAGLDMQEGFLSELFRAPYEVLQDPSPAQLRMGSGNALVFVSPASDAGKLLQGRKSKENPWPARLKNHQSRARNYVPVDAFLLQGKNGKLFVVSSTSEAERQKVLSLIQLTKETIDRYDLKKGWFGATTLLKSVTCMFGHPLEVMGRAMNEGCSFTVFHGYMDFWAQDELNAWMKTAGNPMVVDVGTYNVFGCRDYKGLQLQDIGGDEGWVRFAKEKGGYIFRPVYDPTKDKLTYDGYIATEGNKEQIDMGEKPFVCFTGSLEDDAETSMVLFVPKGTAFTRDEMWKAIMDKRQVAVLPRGLLTGPKEFRAPLNALMLDRIILENLFQERVQLEAMTEGNELVVHLANHGQESVSGTVSVRLSGGLALQGSAERVVQADKGESRTLRIKLQIPVEAMGKTHPLVVTFTDGKQSKSTMTMLDLPKAVNTHTLLYGHAPSVSFPVAVHNFSGKQDIPVTVKVQDAKTGKEVYSSRQSVKVPASQYRNLDVILPLPQGSYTVTTSAQGAEQTCQLGVGESKGSTYLYEDDLNADGIKEYRMENGSVRLTLIATGARVIEYYIKNRDDNALFKLWPEKPEDHNRPFRRRGFYPYGGFEDFLGQASMETHQVYDVEVVKKEGDYVQLKMSTDYYGNRLEKIYTLYGDSPLVEVRYALDFINPEANVIGPQPILALGKEHGTEDVYTVPDMEGMKEYRMRPEEYYGHLFDLKEGWNAGYDTKEDIAFLAAYPVNQPLFLHMWMNHDRNPDSHYFYNEFQPWVPIDQKTTMYFTFYMWGNGGPWQDALQALSTRNLISKRP